MNHNTYSTGYNSKHPTMTESASHSLPTADTQAVFLATWVAGFLIASAFQSIHSHSKMVCYTQNHPFYSRIHHLNENKKLLYAHTANTFKKVQILTSRRDKFIRQVIINYFGRKKSLKKKIWLNILLAGFNTYCMCGECVCVCVCIERAFFKGMEYGLAHFPQLCRDYNVLC